MDKIDKKDEKKELQRLISLTFDEAPEVRKEAALKLAQSDDPAALFALLELSYDKNESVKVTARDILSKIPVDKNAISFAEIFGKAVEPEEIITTPVHQEDAKKKKLLSPVEQIFEKKLGKEKAALMKNRMMPTIEKIYWKAVESKPEEGQKREKSIQRMLTSYVGMLSGLDKLIFEEKKEREQVKVQTIEETKEAKPNIDVSRQDELMLLEEVGVKVDNTKIARDLENLENEEKEKKEGSCVELNLENKYDKSIFRKAYDIMMASDGDEEIMRRQSQRLIKQLEEDVKLAFMAAKHRFKTENITNLTELKNGMRNVNTDELIVKSVEHGEYLRTKTKKDNYTRIVVNSEDGSEGIIYLFEGRGSEVKPGMKIKVVKGQVKTFSFSGETAITIGNKGNVYIVL